MTEIANVSSSTFDQLNNAQNLPLGGLVIIALTERSNLLESKVRDQLNAVQNNNDKLADLNEMMAQLRNDLTGIGTEADDTGAISPEVESYLAATFSDFEKSKDGTYQRADMELQLENLKGKADSLSSVSQLDMVNLQSVMGKYEQSIEWLSNLISKMAGTTGTITRNMA
ncbi:hypothetical protein [Vibrio sp. TBV020]|uniref:hypothetical protein n=1 Tax=Vibrio sp. TBV020 TaxID=3137398 RepID=UPI0038CD2131